MSGLFHNRRIKNLVIRSKLYLDANFAEQAVELPPPSRRTAYVKPPEPPVTDENGGRNEKSGEGKSSGRQGVNFSTKLEPVATDGVRDNYNSDSVGRALRGLAGDFSAEASRRMLDNSTDMSFVDMMFYYINKKSLTNAEVYKAAMIDRRLFSKIISDRAYKPSKDTCIALVFALKLSLTEADDILARAGYTLSHSSKKDIIIEYFLKECEYDLDDLNEVLFRLKLDIIGR